MAFESVASLNAEGRRTGRNRARTDSVVLRRVWNNKKEKTETYLIVRLGLDVMRSCRWVVGDRVDMLVDRESGAVLIKRVLSNENGFVLSAQKMHKGTTKTATFQVGYKGRERALPDLEMEKKIEIIHVTYSPEGLSLTLPLAMFRSKYGDRPAPLKSVG